MVRKEEGRALPRPPTAALLTDLSPGILEDPDRPKPEVNLPKESLSGR